LGGIKPDINTAIPFIHEVKAMQIKGIKRGKNIELLEELNIPDGSEIIIKVQVVQGVSDEERLQKMKEFLATPREGRKELVKILNELDRERHAHWDKQMDNQNV
jgi:predicted DNA-binding antitoxin AbrB/MazE fold protein